MTRLRSYELRRGKRRRAKGVRSEEKRRNKILVNKLAGFELGTRDEKLFYFRLYFALPSATAGCPWGRLR